MSESNGSLPSADEYIERAFGEGGYLAQRFSGYRQRSGQLALARAVDYAMAAGEHLLAEAPCGTGKSLAYLIPASYESSKATRDAKLRALESAARAEAAYEDGEEPSPEDEAVADPRQHVVVVTANIALQEQLVSKDLPLLKEILPWEFTFALYKGRNNYACLNALDDLDRDVRLGRGPKFDHTDDYDQLEELKSWIEDCRAGTVDGKGDMSNLPFEPNFRVWRLLSVGADECKGSDCAFYEPCFSVQAHRAARKANIIVTNYHILLAHLKVRQMTGLDLILPPHHTLIMDEAHKLADVARDFFGFRITAEACIRIARRLRRAPRNEHWQEMPAHSENHLQAVIAHAGDFFNELVRYKHSSEYKTRIKIPLERMMSVSRAWRTLDQTMQRVEYDLAIIVDQLRKQVEASVGFVDRAKKDLNEFSRLLDRSREIRSDIDRVMKLNLSNENVYFIDVNERGKVALVGMPIQVGPILKSTLFDKTPTVVCTSATLCVGSTFHYIAGEIGCHQYSELVAESPFSWGDQALLVLPKGLPEPNDRDAFPDAVAQITNEVVVLAGGRTLGLFTSNRMRDHVASYIKDKEHEFTILKQGDAPRMKLIQEFKEDISSVLLGTESFWAGVDVPGEALSALVIDRLPFPTPDDPIIDAIAERDPKGWFKNHSVPRAVLQFKQGFGRLIRTVTDLGVVVLLDNRISTKAYGKIFLKSLPPVAIDSNLERIRPFLDRRELEELTDEEFMARAFG